MYKIINDTEAIAYKHLQAFGFSEEQVTPLVTQAKKDMENELTKLKTLIEDDTVSIEALNNVLHALKGLMFQVGNSEIAEQINEIRSHLDSQKTIEEIRDLLFY